MYILIFPGGGMSREENEYVTPACIIKLHIYSTIKHVMQYKYIYPDYIYAYISVLTSGPPQPVRMWQVPRCALTVIGSEVNTENR